MKHLKAKNSYRINRNSTTKYEILTMAIEEIVPASIYEEIPDRDELERSIVDGEMEDPLMLLPMTQDYWQNVHLKFYRRSSPTLPEKAPEKDGQVLVVWKGRQRYQLAKELGYTHIDCVMEPELSKIVDKAKQQK